MQSLLYATRKNHLRSVGASIYGCMAATSPFQSQMLTVAIGERPCMLLGLHQSPGSSYFARLPLSRGPLLCPRYQTSSLIHPHPPSPGPDPFLAESPFPSLPFERTHEDFPCCTFHRFTCVLPPLPRLMCHVHFTLASMTPSIFLVIVANRYPRRCFEACSVFTHVAARRTCWPPTRPFQGEFQPICCLLSRPLCFRVERELPRVGVSPTDKMCLSKAHTTMPSNETFARLR
jgi:hypothetical protein